MKFVMSYGESLDGGPPGAIIYIFISHVLQVYGAILKKHCSLEIRVIVSGVI